MQERRHPDFYDTGLILSNISANDIAIIESLIQDFVFQNTTQA